MANNHLFLVMCLYTGLYGAQSTEALESRYSPLQFAKSAPYTTMRGQAMPVSSGNTRYYFVFENDSLDFITE